MTVQCCPTCGRPVPRPRGRPRQVSEGVATLARGWRSEGMSLAAVARRLEREEIPTARGGAWSPESVRWLLTRKGL